MQVDYIVACGVAWRKTADPVAGVELIEGLQSEDHEVRLLAQSLLAESGEISMNLLEAAVAIGAVNPDFAGPCMATILRSQKRIGDWACCERTLN